SKKRETVRLFFGIHKYFLHFPFFFSTFAADFGKMNGRSGSGAGKTRDTKHKKDIWQIFKN
ncbi:MAG: hypothetical protein II588_02030, partial [Paludibacteraceae bacterium]|nr:hypothetical protein [Paludibacteraceae bacterium]